MQVTDGEGLVVASVPYAGFGGNYQDLPILTGGGFDFPWVATLDADGFLNNQPDGVTLTMKNDDIVYVVAHFEHYSDLVTLEVVPAESRNLGRAIDPMYLELPNFYRNSTPTGFFAFAWDGSALVNGVRKPLPMGDYYLRLTAEKPLAGPGDAPDVWESPMISISRSNGKGKTR